MATLEEIHSSIVEFCLTDFYVAVCLAIVTIIFLIMGALCGKESGDSFAQPGRVLNSAPPAQTSSPVPAAARTRATGGGAAAGGQILGGSAAPSSQDDVRAKAALAAERRFQQKKPAGDLGRKLAAEKGKTTGQTAKEAADQERRRREIETLRENQTQN